MTEYKTFRELVAGMRAAQKRYWRYKTQSNLHAALKLELRVDAWLERHGHELAQQLELEQQQEQEQPEE